MTVYIALAVITVVAAAFVRSQYELIRDRIPLNSKEHLRSEVALVFIFVALFLVSAGRYHVGNDYTRYEEFFHLIPLGEVVPTEAGFNYLVLLMQWLFGRDNKLIIFAFFGAVTIFFMLRAIKEGSDSFLYSFFLFMMMGYYYQSLNTVRYYVAWAVALWALRLVYEHKYVSFVLVILVTASIHKSVLVVIPVYILASIAWKKWYYPAMIVLAGTGFVFDSLYMKIIMKLYPSYEGTSYLEAGTSVINIMKVVAVIVLALMAMKMSKEQPDDRWMLYFKLNFLALLLYAGGSFIPEISRIGYYFTGCQIFFIPQIIAGIENEKIRKIINIIVIVAAIGYFICMLIKGQEHLIRIVPYHTWIMPGNIVD